MIETDFDASAQLTSSCGDVQIVSFRYIDTLYAGTAPRPSDSRYIVPVPPMQERAAHRLGQTNRHPTQTVIPFHRRK